MNTLRSHRFLFAFLSGCLILLLTACGSNSQPANEGTTPTSNTGSAVTPDHTAGTTASGTQLSIVGWTTV